MPNTKLGLTNYLTSSATALKNGTGSGAPALIETAPYKMSNLLSSDRYTLWKSSILSAPTQYFVDFDLGSGKSVGAAAAEGFRAAAGVGPFIDVLYQVSTYTPGGTWLFAGSIPNLAVNLRDDGVEFTPVTARYWRFQLTPSGASDQFSLGKFFLGLLTDLGAQHSPGATYTPMGNRLETPFPGGAIALTELGDDGSEIHIPWQVASGAVAQAFLTLQTLPGSILLFWADGHIYEVYLKGRQITQTRNFQGDYDVVLGKMP